MSVVSLKSIANLVCSEYSFALSRLGIVQVRHMPTFVSIEPVNGCNLHCPECPIGMRVPPQKVQKMDMADYQHILQQVSPWVHTIQLYFQGEPLLNEQLPQMIRLAHEYHLYTIVSTNAQTLTPLLAEQLVRAGVHRIIVSVDGMSQASYQAYRVGGNLHKALEGIGYLRQAKKQLSSNVVIEMQCLRLRSNEGEWKMMRRVYRKIGADRLVFKTAQFYDYASGHPLMPTQPQYNRYVQGADGAYHPKNRLHTPRLTPCHRLWTGCVVDVEGNVRPCCFDKNGEYIWGNLLKQDLKTIWHGEEANRFRNQVLHHRHTLSICHNCTTR